MDVPWVDVHRSSHRWRRGVVRNCLRFPTCKHAHIHTWLQIEAVDGKLLYLVLDGTTYGPFSKFSLQPAMLSVLQGPGWAGLGWARLG